MIEKAIRAVVSGSDLDAETMQGAMQDVLSGDASDGQIAALAVALRMKGETAEEIAAAAKAMRSHCTPVSVGICPLLDTCGTGGDGLSTFNISTVSAIVAAACGVSVAKHGNRAVSSRAGSADLLQALGIEIDASVEQVRASIENIGIGFLFAPSHHGAMKYAAPVRKQLGIRTFFNLLGPLSNPAQATHQLLGVYDHARIEQMAQALHSLDVERAWVVHGEGGLDEVTTFGTTWVAELKDGDVSTHELVPADFGVEPVPLDALAGGDADDNAWITHHVFSGKKSPHRTAILVNTAAALMVAGLVSTVADGATMAAEAIDSLAAQAKLAAWVKAMKVR